MSCQESLEGYGGIAPLECATRPDLSRGLLLVWAIENDRDDKVKTLMIFSFNAIDRKKLTSWVKGSNQ